jgi:hypothetical protein
VLTNLKYNTYTYLNISGGKKVPYEKKIHINCTPTRGKKSRKIK